MNKNFEPTVIAVTAPCDFYGVNARKLSQAINETGSILQINLPDENRTCRATSLIGLLSLGVKKGDCIEFIATTDKDVYRVLNAIAC